MYFGIWLRSSLSHPTPTAEEAEERRGSPRAGLHVAREVVVEEQVQEPVFQVQAVRAQQFRREHAITKLDVYPLPRIDDALDVLSQMKYFTSLDLLSGYWQVKMSEDSVEKTALCRCLRIAEVQ